MLKAFLTVDDELVATPNLDTKGVWINLVNPTDEELARVAAEAKILPDFLRAALDEEERSRIEIEEGQLLILIDVPVSEGDNGTLIYDTIPLGIIVSERAVVTVSLKDNLILTEFEYSKPKTCYTYKKTRFVLQILFKTATYYLRYLKQIDKKSSEIEAQLHKSMKNEELIKLLNLGKSLVYFATSLRANEIVLEKLLKSQLIKIDPDSEMTSKILTMYEEDEELLEDVITENKQAIEMCEIYSNILSNTMDAFASVISNNLNIVMKFLTSVTLVMAIPTMISSFYGMNVPLPFQHSPHAFSIIVGISIGVSWMGAMYLKKREMF